MNLDAREVGRFLGSYLVLGFLMALGMGAANWFLSAGPASLRMLAMIPLFLALFLGLAFLNWLEYEM